jgi:5-hydroxyisourate hydrolase
MEKLTTHVLDTAHGKPAAGIRLELYSVSDGKSSLIKALNCKEILIKG